MSNNKTIIIEHDDSSGFSEKTEQEFKPLHIPPQASTQRFNTILSETTVVTGEKLEFHEEELKRMTEVENYYEIMEKFAEGGQGTISTGKDKILKRYVAIKSLKSNFFDNKQVISNFITEAKITSQLDHPSIIPLYSIHSSAVDEGLHISMKLIHDHTLKELIDDSALLCMQYRKNRRREIEQSILKERLEDFLKICNAISFAHNKNVIHNDLKPENIMIGEFHEVYVMDWGIASLHELGEKAEKIHGKLPIAGTPGYLSPEILTGESLPGPECDQYALGMILFELITLKPGVTGVSVKEVFEKTRDGHLEPFTHRLPHCRTSGDLIAVVKKATALRAEDRYSSVEEMADDIRHFRLNEELKARPDNLPRKIFRLISKHKNLAATIIFIFLLGSAGVTIISLIKQNEVEKESKRKALKMVTLHSSIENSAHFIDRHFFHISHILSRFAEKAIIALKEDKVSIKNCYYPTSLFDSGKNLPPGTIFSPAYGRKINLNVINYSLAPGLKLSEAEGQIQKLAAIRKDCFKYLANSDSDALTLENTEEGRERAIKDGFPIRLLYVALKNGLIINYPGSSGLPENYDPRKRHWYRNVLKTSRQKWTKPYIDASGLGVIISASRGLYDYNQNFYGVASMDMTFDYITNTLMKCRSKDPSVIAKYLIDSDGNVILSSHIALQQLKAAEKDSSEIKFKPFPYPEINDYIKGNKSGQFEVNKDGRTTLIGYAPVQTLGWYYVEEVNLDQYLAPDVNTDYE